MNFKCGWNFVAALTALAACSGCGSKAPMQEAVDAGDHAAAAWIAIHVPATLYKEFKSAAEANDKSAAEAALTKFNAAIAEAQQSLSALKEHPWQATQRCDKACERLLDVEETMAGAEMSKIVEVLGTDEFDQQQRKQIDEAFSRIDEMVDPKTHEAENALHRLFTEMEHVGQRRPELRDDL